MEEVTWEHANWRKTKGAERYTSSTIAARGDRTLTPPYPLHQVVLASRNPLTHTEPIFYGSTDDGQHIASGSPTKAINAAKANKKNIV